MVTQPLYVLTQLRFITIINFNLGVNKSQNMFLFQSKGAKGGVQLVSTSCDQSRIAPNTEH